MTYQWLNRYFGEKVCAEFVEVNSEDIIVSMMGMEDELKKLSGLNNRKKRERLEIIIKEMAAILNANCL